MLKGWTEGTQVGFDLHTVMWIMSMTVSLGPCGDNVESTGPSYTTSFELRRII